MSDIFISYVEEDSSVATQIGDGLQNAGYTTWLYERDSLPGPAYLIQMGDAIEQSQAVVIIISQDSMASNQVTSEVVRAHEGNKPFIPLLHGVNQTEFQQGQPLWRQAIGASTSITIDEGNIPILADRIVRGLDAMGIQPGQTSATVSAVVNNDSPQLTPSVVPSQSAPVKGDRSVDSDLPTGPITYLFTDIEGSTRLWQEHPHDMRAVLARHDALLTSGIEQHSGVVVRSRGEGDSIFAVFVRATDAVAAASTVQQMLIHEPWPEDISIQVRMGLHTGESELRAHDYYGTTVNRCARLRGIAHGGQAVLSLATATLVRDALPEGTSLRDLGSHRLKDLEEPEHVFQLLHPSLPSEFLPLKSLEASAKAHVSSTPGFVGRQVEMGELTGALNDAFTGHGRMVMLVGEPGIGKTRCAQELMEIAQARGAQVVWGQCHESEGAPPYWIWTQAIRGYLQGKDETSLRSVLGVGASDIAVMIPEINQTLSDLQPSPELNNWEQARFRLFDSSLPS